MASLQAHQSSHFPADIEQEIFETAAVSHPTGIPALMLVAYRVKIWVEPLLYRVVFVSRSQRIEHFPHFTTSSVLRLSQEKTSEFLRNSVRHMYLGGFFPGMHSVLEACTGITELTLNIGVFVNINILGAMSRLRRLTVEVDRLFPGLPVDFSHLAFRNITHLEVLDAASDRLTSQWMQINSIPNLTHLAFSDPGFVPIFEEVLRHCDRLACMVFLCADEKLIAGAQSVGADPRFVVSGVIDLHLDWQRGVRGGQDYWGRADAFIAGKRAGNIDGSVYEMVSVDKLGWAECLVDWSMH
ncbi:hypothetical protein B0H14DRAFT_2560228 [Mycena olivaceomarginata]|nr:hypothetical protein B0H14DRAFT_2560228 [Mycena olivaceomarginata]